MYNFKISFFTSCLFWLILLSVLTITNPVKQVAPPLTILEIDASALGTTIKEKKAIKEQRRQKIIEENLASKMDKKNAVEDDNIEATNLAPVFNPLPQIPDDLRYEAFSSKATARFHINAEGEVDNVELVRPCANPRLNVLLIKSLQKWKFVATGKNRIQEINVNFSIK